MAEVVEDIAVSRLLLGIMPVANSSMGEEEASAGFSKALASAFGLDEVSLIPLRNRNGNSQLEDYIINTKKPYIDNQLSEYSAFPDLIEFRNRGFKSCVIMPLMADGRVYSIMRLLSAKEGTFSEQMLRNLAFPTSFISFALMYKSEAAKNLRLAKYFDASFGAPHPQFLVSSDGSVIKHNKAALRAFALSQSSKINDVLGMGFEEMAPMRAPMTVVGGVMRDRIYSVSAQKINDRLVHLVADDVTDNYIYSALNSALSASRESCLLILDTAFTIKNMSDNSEHVFGYSKNVLLNGNIADLVKGEEREDFKKAVFALPGEGVIGGGVDLALDVAGQRFMRYCMRRMPNGYVMLVTRADYEKGMADIKRDLEAFTESSSEIVLGVDEMGYIRACNVSIEPILGYKKDEIIGTDIKALYSEQDVLDRDLNYVKKGGKIDNSFFNLVAKGSERVPATHSIRMMNSADDDGPKYMMVIKELGTKRKLADQESALRKQLIEISRLRSEGDLKSQFIYNISHELRTPLTSIKGFAKLMYEGEFGAVSEGQKDNLSTMLYEADRLMLVIQQVLEAAKLEADKVKLEYKQVDLRALGDNATVKSLEESSKNKGLSFEWKVDFDVPEISADPNRLLQVLVNLVGNAIKFTDSGGISVHVLRDGKSRIRFDITDAGIGINEEEGPG